MSVELEKRSALIHRRVTQTRTSTCGEREVVGEAGAIAVN